MLFYLVVLLPLSWSQVTGTNSGNEYDEVAFDQLAIASETVTKSTKQSEDKQYQLQSQQIQPIDIKINYENSNGFVPMLDATSSKAHDVFHNPSAKPFSMGMNSTDWKNTSNERNNSTTNKERVESEKKTDANKIENDPVYSTEARIFLNLPQSLTNRRSFNLRDMQNEFELLKIKNDTPAIANYQDFYENIQNAMNNDNSRENVGTSYSGHTERAKRIESYVNNYGVDLVRGKNEDPPYDRYYSYNAAQDKKKATYEQEKVASNYHQQDAISYNGHGQSATKQQNTPNASLPRTKQQVNEPAKSGMKNYDENYDNVAMPSSFTPTHHRFSRPVVVAEPANMNYKYTGQLRITSSEDYPTSRAIDSSSSEASSRYMIYNRKGRFRTYDNVEDSRDVSDDSMDYAEYIEKPKRVQKGRRRPYGAETSKRLPKEHRTSLEDSSEFEDQGKRYNLSRSKSNRQRTKASSWMEDDRKRGQDESYEETRYDGRLSGTEMRKPKSQQGSKFKPGNSWNQVSPNIEISHSRGVEIDQLEKPKFIVPLKVNLVPVGNFDHATALGNSQGFDMSNAVLQNFVAATPISAVTTATPILTTSSPTINQNLGFSNVARNVPNVHNIGISTPVPDIIVGQNNFQNPMHTVLLSHPNTQSKFSTNLKPQYMSSTVAPVFAVTSNLNPTLESLPVHSVQSTGMPRGTYVTTSSPSSNVQHVTANQIQSNVQHLLVPQPTLQTLSNLLQAPIQSNSEYNIQVNPRGHNGQNVIDHGGLQMQNIPTISTMTPPTQVLAAESQDKKNLVPLSSTNFLASASFAVGQNDGKQTSNGNYYLHNQNNQQNLRSQFQEDLYQAFKNVNLSPKTKTYIQTTHVVPAVFQPLPTFGTLNVNPQQFVPEQQNIASTNFASQRPRDQSQQYVRLNNAMQQMQLQLQRDQMLKNARLPSLAYQSIDNVGSHTNSNLKTLNVFPSVSSNLGNAHLPSVGTKNVEIVNPNIKPSPIDTTILNAYETMNYPVLTTPIPMFSATSFVTARPAVISTTTAEMVSLQNFLDSLTDAGTKTNQGTPTDLKTSQNQERPMFNPINFVPNMEVVRNQNALNSKLHMSEPLQQNLNLVPLIPGGNFFKPSFASQSELMVKPKLSSDLERYAEQMFKESLKTIYNSQKWNNDRKQYNARPNNSESIDLLTLKNEFQKIKTSLLDSKRNADQMEGSNSENKAQTIEPFKASSSVGDQRKPDQLLAALEQVLKSQPSDFAHSHHENNKSKHNRRPKDHSSSDFSSNANNNFRNTKNLKEFLTPPKPTSHRPKGPFHEKPGKKRPHTGPPRYNRQNQLNGHRPHTRPGKVTAKSTNLETAESNVDIGIHTAPRFENNLSSKYSSHLDSTLFNSYPSLTTASPEDTALNTVMKSLKGSDGSEYDINHPRIHNLLGLLMKNKQLPSRNFQKYFRDKDQLRQFFEDEKRQMQQQFYDDALRDYLSKTSDSTLYSGSNSDVTGDRRIFSKKSTK